MSEKNLIKCVCVYCVVSVCGVCAACAAAVDSSSIAALLSRII